MAHQNYDFDSYADTLNKVQFALFLDYHTLALRWSRARPSLVVNPITGQHYGDPAE